MKKAKGFKKSYYVLAYDNARLGYDEERIVQEMGVRLFEFRRWMRTDEVFRELVERGRFEFRQSKSITTERQSLKHLKKKQRQFLLAYSKCGNIAKTARLTGIRRENHYGWLERDKKYAAAFKIADEDAVDGLEEQAWLRGRDGVRKYKFTQAGRPQWIKCEETDEGAIRRENADGDVWYERHYYEYDYSDTLLIFLLKARRPDLFRDKPIQVSQNTNTTQNIGLDMNALIAASEQNNVIDVDYVDATAQKLIEQKKENT